MIERNLAPRHVGQTIVPSLGMENLGSTCFQLDHLFYKLLKMKFKEYKM